MKVETFSSKFALTFEEHLAYFLVWSGDWLGWGRLIIYFLIVVIFIIVIIVLGLLAFFLRGTFLISDINRSLLLHLYFTLSHLLLLPLTLYRKTWVLWLLLRLLENFLFWILFNLDLNGLLFNLFLASLDESWHFILRFNL